MLGSELKTIFEGIVEDSMDETLTYQLMNRAKGEVESLVDWEILKKRDSSKTAVSSDLWNTPGKALPTDFYLPRKLYVGTERQPWDFISFENSHLFQTTSRRWYIDLAQSKFYLTGTVSETKTLYLYYIYATTDFTASNAGTTSPVWPERFHILLPFKMAELWFAKDMTEPSRSWDTKWKKEYLTLWNAMLQWDARLKVAQRSGENSVFDNSTDATIFTA